MSSYSKILQFSNFYYNKGLTCANVHDMSGAIDNLSKSLRYNKNNIDARNLLGLCYYEIGECVDALREWVISINLKSEDNIAAEYIDDIQPDITRTGRFNQCVKKYNQALIDANHQNEDLAIVQLKRVIGINPKFLRAALLLALLYIHNGQYKEALNVLEGAEKIDANNTMLRRYMKEAKEELAKKEEKKNKGKKTINDDGTVAYISENDTIIKPSHFRDNATVSTMINILFGLIVGVLIGVFLIVPGVKREASRDSAQKLVEANNNIATKNAAIKDYQAKISDLTKKLNALNDTTESSNTNMSFYKNLLAMYVSFNNGEYREAGEALSKINEDNIENDYKEVYEKLKAQVNDKYCQMLYAEAGSNYNQGNYEEAIGTFEKIIQLNPTYGDGNALYFLAQSYRLTGDNQKAITYYQRLINECPDSAKYANAKAHLERLTK